MRLGAIWIPTHFIEDFIIEEFNAPKKFFEKGRMKVQYYKAMNRWEINWRADFANTRVVKTYGTDRLNGYELLEKALNLRDAKVYTHIERDGKNIEMSFKEFELLTYFVENKGLALSREKILNNVWNYDYYGDARTIDTHVKKLRKKMGEKGDYIKTIWGMGYKFIVD